MTFNNGALKIPLDYLEQGHDITPCDNKIPILSKWQNKVIKKDEWNSKYIRNNIGFKNILISDDLSMKSLEDDMKGNTTKAFKAGCDIALHCNGNINEMKIVANNSPLISKFIIKKTSQFYKILR